MALVPVASAATAAVVGTIAIAAFCNLGEGIVGCPTNLQPCNAANIRDDSGKVIGVVRTGEPIVVTGKSVDHYTPVKTATLKGWIYSPYVEVKQDAPTK